MGQSRAATVGSILLAAGRGTRLRPLTDCLPKPALPILDVPLAAFGLERLIAAAPPVVVNVSYLADELIQSLARWNTAEVEFFREEPEALGSGGTVAALRERAADRLLTWNSDHLSDLDPGDLLAAHDRSGAPATVVVANVARGADFRLSGGRAVGFVNRKKEPDVTGGLFLGAAVFERDTVALIPESVPVDLAKALLLPLAERGDLNVHVHPGYALDVGTPERYLQASLDALADVLTARGGWPGEIVGVDGGRAYVGPGADVDEASLGPGAAVLEGATVDRSARIDNAIVWPGQRVPAGTELSGTIWASPEIVVAASSGPPGVI